MGREEEDIDIGKSTNNTRSNTRSDTRNNTVNHYRCVVCFKVTSFDDYNYKGIRTWYYVSNGTKLEAFVCDDCKEKRKEWIYQAKYPS
jgi:hypothetical protein